MHVLLSASLATLTWSPSASAQDYDFADVEETGRLSVALHARVASLSHDGSVMYAPATLGSGSARQCVIRQMDLDTDSFDGSDTITLGAGFCQGTTIDSQGNLYAVTTRASGSTISSGHNRLYRVDTTGAVTFVALVGNPFGPYYVALDRSETRAYVPMRDSLGGHVNVVDISGGALTSPSVFTLGSGVGPNHVIADPFSDDMFVFGSRNTRFYRVNSAGPVSSRRTGLAGSSTGGGTRIVPGAVLVYAAGVVHAYDYDAPHDLLGTFPRAGGTPVVLPGGRQMVVSNQLAGAHGLETLDVDVGSSSFMTVQGGRYETENQARQWGFDPTRNDRFSFYDATARQNVLLEVRTPAADDPCLLAVERLRLADRASAPSLASHGTTEVGADADAGDIVSDGAVRLRSRAFVDGSVVSGDAVTLQHGADVSGTIEEDVAVDLPSIPTVAGPGTSATPLVVNSGESHTILPGALGQVTVNSNATLVLDGAGDFGFDRLVVNQGGVISYDDGARIFVHRGMTWRGSQDGPGALPFAQSGSGWTHFEASYDGSITAPSASVRLAGNGGPLYVGAQYVARQLLVESDVTVTCE